MQFMKPECNFEPTSRYLNEIVPKCKLDIVSRNKSNSNLVHKKHILQSFIKYELISILNVKSVTLNYHKVS